MNADKILYNWGTGLTTEEMKKSAAYTDWNFASVWKIGESNSYPKLR